ncbi:MAG: flagellar protein FlaG [Hyphomicrobiales bacterium]
MDIASTSAGAPPSVASPPPVKAPEKETIQPIKTDEPRAKAVQAETSSERVADKPDENPPESLLESDTPAADSFVQSATTPKVDRLFEVEPDTETLIYKAIDAEDGDIVRQVPEDVILKLRATYNDGASQTDLEPETPRNPIDRIA